MLWFRVLPSDCRVGKSIRKRHSATAAPLLKLALGVNKFPSSIMW